jgi:hypothetical protein
MIFQAYAKGMKRIQAKFDNFVEVRNLPAFSEMIPGRKDRLRVKACLVAARLTSQVIASPEGSVVTSVATSHVVGLSERTDRDDRGIFQAALDRGVVAEEWHETMQAYIEGDPRHQVKL